MRPCDSVTSLYDHVALFGQVRLRACDNVISMYGHVAFPIPPSRHLAAAVRKLALVSSKTLPDLLEEPSLGAGSLGVARLVGGFGAHGSLLLS